MPIEEPIPHGALNLARNLYAELSAAVTADPNDARAVAALGHAAAVVALLEGAPCSPPRDA